jgi:hypothetical protein
MYIKSCQFQVRTLTAGTRVGGKRPGRGRGEDEWGLDEGGISQMNAGCKRHRVARVLCQV